MSRSEHADVLIVGAGSAGCVVAERLSSDPGRAVTVLEAGADTADPALAALVADGTELPIGSNSPLVRRYRAELTAEPGAETTLVRGSAVGGSGAVNGGYFCRGLPRDFDETGLPGWSWADLLPHYRAIETDRDFSGPEHGDSGPIPVRRTRDFDDSAGRFVDAARDADFGWLPDLNDVSGVTATMPGVGAVPLNIVDGVRTDPAAAYLRPALDRPNLTLRTGTRVLRVDISAGRAIGVQAVGPGGPLRLTADRIVLCAGAIESAHLLMLSGVGEAAMLRAAGVEVVTALPVGSSCTDHPEWVLPVDWAMSGRRPPLEAVLHTADDMEIRPYTGGFIGMAGGDPSGRTDWPHVGVALMQPAARGRLTLVSADPAAPPRIEAHYDVEADQVTLRRGVQLVREMIGDTTEVGHPIWSTSQHLCGSVPMGLDGDERAVLDPQCRVRGVDRLWVIDGAALPIAPSRGPHATILMLAHRAAEFVGDAP